MTFGIYIGNYSTIATGQLNAYLEFFLAEPVSFSNLVRLVPPPGVILPDPRILCCFGEQLRCIEINGLRIMMISGKVLHYGTVGQ